jgi:hypothetical protein
LNSTPPAALFYFVDGNQAAGIHGFDIDIHDLLPQIFRGIDKFFFEAMAALLTQISIPPNFSSTLSAKEKMLVRFETSTTSPYALMLFAFRKFSALSTLASLLLSFSALRLKLTSWFRD